MRIISLHIIIFLRLSMPNVIMCWVPENRKNTPLETNQTVVTTLQPSTTSFANTTITFPEEKDIKKRQHHHKKKKKHKKHKKHHHKHHWDGSKDEDLTAYSIATNSVETALASTQKSTRSTGLIYPSPKITHSTYLITETKTRLHIEPSTTTPPINADSSTRTTTTIIHTPSTDIHQSLELPLAPSVSSSIRSYTVDRVSTIQVKASSILSLVSSSLTFKAPTPVSGFPFIVITPVTTINSNSITSSSLLSASSTQKLSYPTYYVVPPLDFPGPQENRPGKNARRRGDPNKLRNQLVDLNSTNHDIGLGVGIGIAVLTIIILIGLFVQRYKRKRNNQNDLGVYFSEKESHKSILSSISTKWRPNSFIKMVSCAVSRFPSKLPSLEDNLITYPPELYSPVKANYHESYH